MTSKEEIEALDDLACLTEQTANCLYSPGDTMWDFLLKFRDKLNKKVEKLNRCN